MMPQINNISIRPLGKDEIHCLDDLLYAALFLPEGMEAPPHDIIKKPDIAVYIKDFGSKKDDYCLVADLNGKIIGGVWVRILADEIKGFGNIDPQTPEFAISLFKEYRKLGIGTELMSKMITYLKETDYEQTSLSVQKENYAVKMYTKCGFQIIRENEHDFIMVLKLKNNIN